ncbi:MAG: hypothetical protein H6R21_2263 [Proteobacteria bacterium]|nr:hypothetical protein [Pseudomonadota bacterium]
MGFDQKGETVFNITFGKNNKWDVSETGFDKPLASFDTETDARNYAEGLARAKQDSTVEHKDKAVS